MNQVRLFSVTGDAEFLTLKPSFRARPEPVGKFEQPAAREELAGIGRVHRDADAHRSSSTNFDGVALAAGIHEVSAVDGGPGIVRRQNVVHAVATGAIGYDLRAQFGRQAVVAGQVGGGTAARDSEFFVESDAFMTAGAGDAGKVGGCHR